MPTLETSQEQQRRQDAVERLEKRAAFWPHLAAYLLINTLLVTVWFLAVDGGLFWPIFPMLGWGIGLFFHAWGTFRRPLSEDRIQQEMERLGHRP